MRAELTEVKISTLYNGFVFPTFGRGDELPSLRIKTKAITNVYGCTRNEGGAKAVHCDCWLL